MRHGHQRSLRFAIAMAGLIFGLTASPLHAAKTCYDCHKQAKTDFLQKKNVHAPVKSENCEACHKRHGFSNQLILVDNTAQLCYSCHADLKDKYAVGNVHVPLTKANCWECHDPHSSDKTALLRKGPDGADDPSSCFPCHKTLLTAPGTAAHKHAPYEELKCVICHDPHNSPERNLLKADSRVLCATCHKTDSKQFVKSHEGKLVQGLACADCHTGHSSSTKGLVSTQAHAPFAEGSCDACHNVPSDSGKVTFPEGVTAGNVCANCHADQAAAETQPVPHPAVESGNCDNCHAPHTSSQEHLLTRDEGAICADCHTDFAADTTMVLHAPVIAGDCGACHDIHGSKNQHLLKATDASLCLGCHSTFATERDSAKTVHAGAEDCLQCHNPHQGKSQALLRDTPDNLCKTCHENDPASLTAASTHAPYMNGACATCHSPHFSNTEHLVRGEKVTLCRQCHDDVDLRLDMPTKHPPVQEDCGNCHTPHYSKQPALLATPQKELCTTCHSPEDLGTSKQYAHTPAAQGDCTGCHNPHGSVAPKLLTGRMQPFTVKGVTVLKQPVLTDKRASLCYTCHEATEAKFAEGKMHAPVAEGKCDACHTAHGSDHRGFTKESPATLCGSCHTIDPALMAKHDNYNLATANCADCHNPHSSKQEHLLRANEHPPFTEKSCEGCHTKGPDGSLQLAGDLNSVCGTCHDLVQSESGKLSQHAPFAGGQCTDCHSAHASDYSKLLKDDGNRICLTCHTDLKTMQSLPSQHRPFQEGKCLDCHKPHASDYAKLTTKPAESFCISCHTDLKEQMDKGTAHSPARAGKCQACHVPHAGPTPSLLVKGQQELCADCHDLTSPTISTAHRGFSMAKVDCRNCHEAHASPKGTKSLLLPKAHAPFAARTCDKCHEPTGTRALLQPGKQLCLSCHPDFQKEIARAVVHEPLNNENGCVACHGPHVGFGSALQKKEGVKTCLTCHNGEEFTGSLKHKPAFEDCTTCHSPHSADYKNLLNSADINELCETCHADAQKTHYHPMGKDVINPRTRQPLNCVGCHTPHSSNYGKLLIGDLSRQLCVSCHDVSH